MSIILGLDCGGSSCRALATNVDGEQVFQGQAGAANLASTPPHRLRQNLQKAIAGCPAPKVVCGCFAGLLTDADRGRACDLLQGLFPDARVRAEPDYVAALYAPATPIDVCVIAGTGSLVCSIQEGRPVKSGGRGFILGDAGSAFRNGRDALVRYLDAPETASDTMREAVLQTLGSEIESEVVARLYQSATPASVLAKLARPLAIDAKSGDEAAVEIVEKNMMELARVTSGHIARHFPSCPKIRLGIAGGLWQSAVYVRAFESSLCRCLDPLPFELTVVKRPPVYGAVALAKEMVFEH
jgi:N-acetylglucosamine kinase-like BadF-type ATPase